MVGVSRTLVTRRRHGITLVSVVLLLSFAFVAEASAHRAYEGWTTVWSNGPNCLNEKVSLDHVTGDEGGKFWTEGSSQKAFLGVNCIVDWTQVPQNFRIRTETLKLTGGTWGICTDTGYIKNASDAAYMILTVHAGGAAPCGAGWYRTKGFSHIYWNGGWRGGTIVISVNERHYLPCAEGATCP